MTDFVSKEDNNMFTFQREVTPFITAHTAYAFFGFIPTEARSVDAGPGRPF